MVLLPAPDKGDRTAGPLRSPDGDSAGTAVLVNLYVASSDETEGRKL